MVRLRQAATKSLADDSIGFNPTMVRLRLPEGDLHARYRLLRFNPTMVRLRPPERIEEVCQEAVSIPLWCDCDQRPGSRRGHPLLVSIPLWCDCDGPYAYTVTRDLDVSIPLWCDCDKSLFAVTPAP